MSSGPPRAWFIAQAFGRPSEVWMRRQATGMPRLKLRVITHECADPTRTEAAEYDLTQLATPAIRGRNAVTQQLYLRWNRLRNRRFAGFRGAPAEAAEWQRLADQDRPRVALCQYGPTALRMHPVLEALGVPLVAHFHGFDLSSGLGRPLYRRNLAKLAPRFAACVVVADYQRDWLLNNGCDPSKIHKIPCGAPMDEFSPAERVDAQPCRFLMVGRLTPKKRPDLSIRAFGKCLQTCPDTRLTVIGDGPLESSCKKLAAELRVDHAIEWLGSQPSEIVKENLATAGAFIQHSVTAEDGDKEGWPVAIAEAAGCGLPVVSTTHASIPEQIDHEVTGLLCEELDWETMADHLIRLAQNPDMRTRMGQAARKKLSAFTTAIQVGKLEALLLSFCSD